MSSPTIALPGGAPVPAPAAPAGTPATPAPPDAKPAAFDAAEKTLRDELGADSVGLMGDAAPSSAEAYELDNIAGLVTSPEDAGFVREAQQIAYAARLGAQAFRSVVSDFLAAHHQEPFVDPQEAASFLIDTCVRRGISESVAMRCIEQLRGGGVQDGAEAHAEIKKIMADPHGDFAKALSNRMHPGHAYARERWNSLHARAYKETQ